MSLPIAREGYPFIFAALLAAIVLYTLSLLLRDHWVVATRIVSLAFFLLAIFIASFFRDPDRIIRYNSEAIIAPADGTIIEIKEVEEQRYLKKMTLRISIFMSIFNVHINRAPIRGTVDFIYYHPGKFISAFKEKASDDNESLLLGVLDSDLSRKIAVKFVAGLIARRIVFYKKLHQELMQGERINMIKFGSRVDVFCPIATEIRVKKGERVRAGETVIGIFKDEKAGSTSCDQR